MISINLVYIKELVRMWWIIVAVFIVTLVGLFIVGIKLFCLIKTRSCTFLFASWSSNLRMKSPAVCISLLRLLVRE